MKLIKHKKNTESIGSLIFLIPENFRNTLCKYLFVSKPVRIEFL